MAGRMHRSDLRSRLVAALDRAPSPAPAPGDRLAAVLLPLVEGRSLVFTRRSESMSRHAGEISFPGGLQHDEDRDLAETALRETEEELGISPASVEVLGALPSVHTFVSGILIVPFVGLLERRPALTPNVDEIAEVLEFPLDDLAEAETEVEWQRDGHVYRGYAYVMGDHTIWGATARILQSLIEAVRKEPA